MRAELCSEPGPGGDVVVGKLRWLDEGLPQEKMSLEGSECVMAVLMLRGLGITGYWSEWKAPDAPGLEIGELAAGRW